MTAPKGLLLDLDGTIADSIDFFCGLTRQVLQLADVPLPAHHEIREAIAFGIAPPTRFLPPTFPDREAFLERTYHDRWFEWTERYGREVEPLPGACEAVERLHRQGFRIALVTSSSGDLPFLDRWGIRELFSAVINGETVRRIKPDPEPLLSGLSRLGLTTDAVLSVGDTPVDVQAGRAAGIRTVGVLTGAGTRDQLDAAGVSVVLSSLGELPQWLEMACWAGAT